MDRYVEQVKSNITEYDIKSSKIIIHPEEAGNDKLNIGLKNGFADLAAIDSLTKDIAIKTDEVLSRTIERLKTVVDTINWEKERLQDISMLCNSRTDFDNVIPMTDSNFTGTFNYDENVFSANKKESSSLKIAVLDITGNGYEGNKYVIENDQYLEEVLNTSIRKNIYDNNISSYWEYSRLTAANTEEYLLSDFNTDDAEAKCTITLKFSEAANQINLKTEFKTLKVTGIKYSNDNLYYTDLNISPFIINNKEESYKNQDYVYGSNLIAFPKSLYLKITLESTNYLDDVIGFERSYNNDNDQVETIRTLVNTAKRHVIRINNIEAYTNQYDTENILKTKELITSSDDIYAISIFANIYLPDSLSNNYVKFNLTVNGKDYDIKPINSYSDGVKVIRFSQGKTPTEYTKYIGEKITSAYLTINIKAKTKATPYINNLKILLGGEI